MEWTVSSDAAEPIGYATRLGEPRGSFKLIHKFLRAQWVAYCESVPVVVRL